MGAPMNLKLLWLILFVLTKVDVRTQDVDQVVLSWNMTTPGGSRNLFNFRASIFTEFYKCLCKKQQKTCWGYKQNNDVQEINDDLTLSQNELIEFNASKKYECYEGSSRTIVRCVKLSGSNANCLSAECSSYLLTDHTITCDFEPVEITWQSGYETEVIHDDTTINITQCKFECVSTEQPESSTTRTTRTTTYGSTDLIDTTAELTQDTDDEDNTTIIIAVVVSITAVLVIVVIIGIVLWRRKKNAKGRATRYATKDNTGSNGNVGNPRPANGRGASNGTGLHNYSLANLDQDGKSSGNVGSVSVSYAKVDLEEKHAARRSAAESTNNEEPPYSEYNYHQNYSEVGPPVSPYNGDHIATGADEFNGNSTPKFERNGKTAVNIADNGVTYSEIAINDTTCNNDDDEDDEIEPYHTSGASGPSGREHPHGKTSQSGTKADDPQYSLASDVKPSSGNDYSQLHDPVRNITNPYNDLMPHDGSVNSSEQTRPKNEYARLHDPVRNITNPYNVLNMTDEDQLNNRSSV